MNTSPFQRTNGAEIISMKPQEVMWQHNCNTNSVRKLILDGRKADNVVFIIEKSEHKDMISEAITREVGNRLKTGKHKELPDVYYLWGNELCCLWNKQKGKL